MTVRSFQLANPNTQQAHLPLPESEQDLQNLLLETDLAEATDAEQQNWFEGIEQSVVEFFQF